MIADASSRAYWLGLFSSHLDVQLRAHGADAATTDAVRAAWADERAAIEADPARHGSLDLIVLDTLRRRILHAHGVIDEFREEKERETEAAFELLPAYLERLDEHEPADALHAIVTGMLAGNLFDLGATATTDAFADRQLPFDRALARVPARPWFRDDLDALTTAWTTAIPQRAMIFVDNAGADFVLGVLPLVRWLRTHGAAVAIVANDGPALNDVTVDESHQHRARAAVIDPRLGDPAIEIVPSGTSAPLIDLRDVGPACQAAAHAVDALVIVGMGRGLESNWSARFTVPVLRVAMVKDPQVAQGLGATLFDAVCAYTPPSL